MPRGFAEDFAAREGEPGRAWADGLPVLAEKYLGRWGLEPDGAPMHGFAAVVWPVRRGAQEAVLKIGWPHEEARDEALALSTWDGDGAVRLLEHDADDWALLLERLDPARNLMSVPLREADAVAASMIARLSVPSPGLTRTLPEVARDWVEELADDNADEGSPVPGELVDLAVSWAAELGPRAAARMVNEDLHYENVLAGTREPWLVIDPKPLEGDPEFGLIPLLWNRSGEADPVARLARLVELAGLDLDLARRWTFVRAVDNWIWSAGEEYSPDDPATTAALERIAYAMLD